MSQEILNTYFKKARSWADDQFGRLEQSRNRYQTAFIASMGLNIAAVVAIATLANYQTLIPIMIHHYDNGVTTVEPLKQREAPINRAQVESDIARYIQHREAYDATSYRAQFDLVQLLSNDSVERDYLKEQEKDNPNAPIKLLGSTSQREVHVYSINFMDSLLENQTDTHKNHQNLAEVVFTLIDTDKQSGKSTEAHYNALISWQYTNVSDSPDIRWKNWDGFEVTRYSKQRRVEHTA